MSKKNGIPFHQGDPKDITWRDVMKKKFPFYFNFLLGFLSFMWLILISGINTDLVKSVIALICDHCQYLFFLLLYVNYELLRSCYIG